MNTHHYVHYSSKNLNANLSNDYKPVVIAIKNSNNNNIGNKWKV